MGLSFCRLEQGHWLRSLHTNRPLIDSNPFAVFVVFDPRNECREFCEFLRHYFSPPSFCQLT